MESDRIYPNKRIRITLGEAKDLRKVKEAINQMRRVWLKPGYNAAEDMGCYNMEKKILEYLAKKYGFKISSIVQVRLDDREIILKELEVK